MIVLLLLCGCVILCHVLLHCLEGIWDNEVRGHRHHVVTPMHGLEAPYVENSLVRLLLIRVKCEIWRCIPQMSVPFLSFCPSDGLLRRYTLLATAHTPPRTCEANTNVWFFCKQSL